MKIPSYDETARLLGSITEDYSWQNFKPILYSPEKLKEWIQAKMPQESDRPMNPDDPAVGERGDVSVEAESQMFEFWAELTPEEQAMFETAFLDLYGRAGKAHLPISLSPRNRD